MLRAIAILRPCMTADEEELRHANKEQNRLSTYVPRMRRSDGRRVLRKLWRDLQDHKRWPAGKHACGRGWEESDKE